MKDKKVIIIVGVIAFLLMIGGGLLVLSKNNTAEQANTAETAIDEDVYPTISPDELGLEMETVKNDKYIKFTINNTEGIENVEYEILYDAISEGHEVSQGLGGDIKKSDIKGGKIVVERELGTCSTGGKCRFDEGVKEVKVVLKVTKSDGKTYQAEKTHSL